MQKKKTEELTIYLVVAQDSEYEEKEVQAAFVARKDAEDYAKKHITDEEGMHIGDEDCAFSVEECIQTVKLPVPMLLKALLRFVKRHEKRITFRNGSSIGVSGSKGSALRGVKDPQRVYAKRTDPRRR